MRSGLLEICDRAGDQGAAWHGWSVWQSVLRSGGLYGRSTAAGASLPPSDPWGSPQGESSSFGDFGKPESEPEFLRMNHELQSIDMGDIRGGSDIKYSDFRVLLILADMADQQGRGAWPSRSTIGRLAGCSVRTVSYA